MPDRLFVYSTLAPGRPNEHVLAAVPGTWEPATVTGWLQQEGWGAAVGYPGILMGKQGDEIEGWVFTSGSLSEYWGKLDAFEGEGYERVVLRFSANFRSSTAFEMATDCERRGDSDGCSRAGGDSLIGRWVHSASRNPAPPAIHNPPGEAHSERIRDPSDKPSALAVLLRRSRRHATWLIWRLRDWVSFPNGFFRCTVNANAPCPSQQTMPARAD